MLYNNTQVGNKYARWFGIATWFGIAVNSIFVVALLFFPEELLKLLHMQIPVPIIWVQGTGLLLLEISIIYIPCARNPYRYETIAWMTIFVTRGGGAGFFFIAVLFFGQSLGFLSIAVVDLFFGSIEAVFLYLAVKDRPKITESPA